MGCQWWSRGEARLRGAGLRENPDGDAGDLGSGPRSAEDLRLRLQRPQGLVSVLTETHTLVMAQRDCFLALSLNDCQKGRQRWSSWISGSPHSF